MPVELKEAVIPHSRCNDAGCKRKIFSRVSCGQRIGQAETARNERLHIRMQPEETDSPRNDSSNE